MTHVGGFRPFARSSTSTLARSPANGTEGGGDTYYSDYSNNRARHHVDSEGTNHHHRIIINNNNKEEWSRTRPDQAAVVVVVVTAVVVVLEGEEVVAAVAIAMCEAEERADSLEGWVAIRADAFKEQARRRVAFMVAWNDVEEKAAISCHDRTAQRERALRTARGGPGQQQEVEEVGDTSWAGLFSCEELRGLHVQLSALSPALEAWVPAFPESPSGVWALLFPAHAGRLRDPEREALCSALQLYLAAALDACGWTVLRELMFGQEDELERYYESLSDLRRAGHEAALTRAKAALRE
ncbi:unnamed protein product, partial [Lampetra planeri]